MQALAQSRTIGLLGGMSWESTALHYRLLNTSMNKALGGHHNARSVLVTFDFADLLAYGNAGQWDRMAADLIAGARRLKAAGADCAVITANTAHAVADEVESAIDVPLLHIVDAAAAAISARSIRRVGLIGTKFCLELGFYQRRLRERHGIDAIVPEPEAREALHRIIIDELTRGEVRSPSRERCLAITRDLAAAGADAIVVACTELPLLVGEDDFPLPAFDTTRLHVEAMIRYALGD
jgi:aspartate racemase